ncbi:hypothetical protein OEA41_008702 [Lepraria neglecta]|uniref:Uncharacterized protein n=1 Tax=Lepraria neglecta TaxID=209136 RepID=A0AAD9Z082_9LECA|nr:hypothetical protein OEA41_008702 [Lepraria neglecta]
MAFIKQEPLSEEQWDQLIKNFDNQPDAYFPDDQNTTFDQDGSSVNNTANQGFEPVTSQVAEKSEPVDPQMDWTFMNPADQSIPADNLNLGPDQVSAKLDDIKALYGQSTSFKNKNIYSVTG